VPTRVVFGFRKGSRSTLWFTEPPNQEFATARTRTTVLRTVPATFSASETFDVGVDLGSTVSLDYFERRPFRFDGTIHRVDVKMN